MTSVAVEDAVAAAVTAEFGLHGTMRRLDGEVDETFRLDTPDGPPFLIKLAEPGGADEAVGFQAGLLRHLQAAAPGLPVPRVRAAASGADFLRVRAGPLEGRIIWVTSFLPGDLLRGVRSTPRLRTQLGRDLAALDRALRGYDHPAAHRYIIWDIQRHGIVPDLVVMGKPMGNGMPIAGIAARPGLLAEFGTKIRYFNTFGGNSVCVAAAAAVLDVIEDEGLLDNSRVVGGALRAAVAEAARGNPRVRDVRGAGLYVAVEFVDPGTGEPDGATALGIVNDMRERRVLISATGPHGNMLKIRPPLPFGPGQVDQFMAAFTASLADVA